MSGIFDGLYEYLLQNPTFSLLLCILGYLLFLIFSPVIFVPLAAIRARINPMVRKVQELKRSATTNPLWTGQPQNFSSPNDPHNSAPALRYLQSAIQLGYIGWIIAGIWILLATVFYLFRIAVKSIMAGEMASPAVLLSTGMPAAVGLFLMVAGGFLLSFFRMYMEGLWSLEELRQNYIRGRTFTLMVFCAILSIASVYHAWANPFKPFVILFIFASTVFFLLSAIGLLNIGTIAFSVLAGTFLGMFFLSRIGLLIGAISFFFLLAFMYHIIPEALLLSREHRHRRAAAAHNSENSTGSEY
jgi:MFS family permease